MIYELNCLPCLIKWNIQGGGRFFSFIPKIFIPSLPCISLRKHCFSSFLVLKNAFMISIGAEEKAKEIEVCLSFNYLYFAILMIPYSLQLVGTPEVTLQEYILSKVQTVRVFFFFKLSCQGKESS